MANKEQLAKIKEGVDPWNRWMESNLRITPDLLGADLEKANLGEVNFEGTNLGGSNLRRVDLERANLRSTNLEWANLRGANLKGANLRGAYLRGADLEGADFEGADLEGADFEGADLKKTNLEGANLRSTNFEGANLRGANLIGANLIGADLYLTVLTRTNLKNAAVGFTRFGHVDLSRAKGLETVYHYGPSTVGIDTIIQSRGEIPEVFLRGAGVPENFIRQLIYLNDQIKSFDFYSCFISYSHTDKPFARRLHEALQGRGIRCWLDEHQLLPGDDIHDQIDRGIRLWDKVLLCCSETSLNSWWVDKELDRALQKEEQLWRERGKKILLLIPLDLDGHVFNWDRGKAAMIRSRFITDFQVWEKDKTKFEAAFEQLVKALMTEDAGREPAPDQKV